MSALIPQPHPSRAPLPWKQGADPARRYVAKLSKGSQATMASALRGVAKLITGSEIDPGQVPWHRLTITVADALAAKIRENYSAAGANKLFAAVRGTLTVCMLERWFVLPDGMAFRDHYDALARSFKSRPTHKKRHGRLIADAEIRTLFEHADIIEAAILALGIGAGLRRAEIAKLQAQDIDMATGRVAVHHGKGDKDRASFLPHEALRAVAAYKRTSLAATARPPSDGTIFGLSAKEVWETLKGVSARAGVPFKPHDLRRTFVTRQLRAKTSLGSVQAAVGHQDMKTTSGYDLTGEDEMRLEIQRVDLPIGAALAPKKIRFVYPAWVDRNSYAAGFRNGYARGKRGK